MIKNSFIFLDKVGNKSEQSLWNRGIKDWNDFLKVKKIKGISIVRKDHYNRKIHEAGEALNQENYGYFINKLPQKEMWRLYPQIRESCCFLDLEIDGYGNIVLVGISNYYQTNFFVRGINFETEIIERELAKYQAVITFNGSSFDLPRLKKFGVNIGWIHMDLKPLCINLNLMGGLKEIEKQLNLKRPAHLYGNPVDLWQAFHASGDKEYLDLLIEYNREDVENLKLIMEFVYKKMREKAYKEINPTK